LQEIKFNGASNVPIRIDADTAIGDPTGTGQEDIQWERGLRESPNGPGAWTTDQVAPAAFLRGHDLQAEVKFSVPNQDITSIKVRATNTGSYGDFPDTVVAISGGVGSATFTTSGPAVDTVDVEDITFHWVLRSVTVGGQEIAVDAPMRDTTNRIYTLEALPTAPMAVPWATELELAAGLARGESTEEGIVNDETRGIHNSGWHNFEATAHSWTRTPRWSTNRT
jgi:hypothetical protein